MPAITKVTATKTNKPLVGMANPSPASLLSSSFLPWPMQETRTADVELQGFSALYTIRNNRVPLELE